MDHDFSQAGQICSCNYICLSCDVIRGWPSASKIEAKILKDFQLNLDHPGEMRKGNRMKTIRNLNLDHSKELLNVDHPGDIHFLISLPNGLDSTFPFQMV